VLADVTASPDESRVSSTPAPQSDTTLSTEAMPTSVTAASPMWLFPNTNARGLTTLVVEQVSHHPPITAYYIANSSRGVTLEGHNAQKITFSVKSPYLRPCALVLNMPISQVTISL
jgi:hypothetical protein